MRLPLLVATVAALSLAFAPAPLRPKPSDRELIQATWAAVSILAGGTEADQKELKNLRLIVKGGRMRLSTKVEGRRVSDQWDYTLDTLSRPKAILCDFGGEWIYRLERDALTICWADGGKPRPTEFTGKAGSGCTLLVFRRIKQ